MRIKDILNTYPFTNDFFDKYSVDTNKYSDLTIKEYLNQLEQDEIDDKIIEVNNFENELNEFIELMQSYLAPVEKKCQSITILPGNHKNGTKENFDKIEAKAGEIISVVGPTGSGKSRLLADIEWSANNDTPTKRTILVDGQVYDKSKRFDVSNKLVAQLSQNMNFIMDLTVKEFIELHASSRYVENLDEIVDVIYKQAISLAGEKFDLDTPVTALSGGQSRALMISDTANLSASPIILIDEIENAGIDRRKALELLVSNDKIVFMSTHDPILGLMANKRIVIRNGGIDQIIETSQEEKNILTDLEKLDFQLMEYRDKLRKGMKLV